MHLWPHFRSSLLSAVGSAFVDDVQSKLEPDPDERSEVYLCDPSQPQDRRRKRDGLKKLPPHLFNKSMVEITLLSLTCDLWRYTWSANTSVAIIAGGMATRMRGCAAGDDVMDDTKPAPKPSPSKKGPHLCMLISGLHDSTIALRASQVSHYCIVYNDTE
jgi:hypothetical protein